MCQAFASNMSAKAQEGGCSTAPLLPLLLPLSWWHTVVAVTCLALLWEFAAPVVGDAATLGAMSRCCVVKVITLTEIQLLQVGGATQLQAREIWTSSDIETRVCVLVCNCVCICLCVHARDIVCTLLKGRRLQPEQLISYCGMQTLWSICYPFLSHIWPSRVCG